MKKTNKVTRLVASYSDIKLSGLYWISFKNGGGSFCQCLTEDLFADCKWMISLEGSGTPFPITNQNFAVEDYCFYGRMYHVDQIEIEEGEGVFVAWRYNDTGTVHVQSWPSMGAFQNSFSAWRTVGVVILAVKKVKWTQGDRDDK